MRASSVGDPNEPYMLPGRQKGANTFPDGGIPKGVMPPTRLQRRVNSSVRPVPTAELGRFPYTQTLNGTAPLVSVANPGAILTKPDQYRAVLMIKNQTASAAGSLLYVAFGQPAGPNSAWFELVNGASVFLDAVVPQDDVYLSASIAGTLYVLGYANSNMTLYGSENTGGFGNPGA